jgi:hypothetical protein
MYMVALNGSMMLILNISCKVVNFVPISVSFFNWNDIFGFRAFRCAVSRLYIYIYIYKHNFNSNLKIN